MLNEFVRNPNPGSGKTGNISDNGAAEYQPSKIGAEPIDTDSARLGLVKEMLQVVLGLEPEVMERVLRLIRGSTDAADIKTPNMRQRIGPRAMDYLRNAIDLARNEGNEFHNDDPDIDMTKDDNLEPGHQHDQGTGNYRNKLMKMMGRGKQPAMQENTNTSFKDYLVEVNMDIDLSDPAVAANQIRKAARMSPDRAAMNNVKDARDNMQDARDMDQQSQTKQIDMKIAALSQQLAQLQQRRAQMLKSQQTGAM